MTGIVIHQSGEGAELLRVTSYGNGLSYAFNLGEGGSPSRDLFLQGDDASELRDAFAAMETAFPDKLTRDIWLELIDNYL
jgi:hypothetical protein